MPIPPAEKCCHRTGFEKSCRELVGTGKCDRWVTFEGEDPINGHDMSMSKCIDDWPITLLVDLARKFVDGTAGIRASTDSFRNAMLEAQGLLPPAQLTRLGKPNAPS